MVNTYWPLPMRKNKIWATKLSNLFAFVQPGFFVTKRGIQA